MKMKMPAGSSENRGAVFTGKGGAVKKKAGMTLIELLAGALTALAILAYIGVRTRHVTQRARVSSARATISAITLSLGMMKDDTGLYPAYLEDLRSPAAPPYLGIPSRFWRGPYLPQGVSLIDPWGEPYFYELLHGAVFGPTVFKRTTGGPLDETFSFPAGTGAGRIQILNEDNPVTAGEVWINGVQAVSPDEFKSISPRIEKDLYLQPQNSIRIRIASEPGRSIILTVTSIHSSETSYILGSYGADGKPGGGGFDEDIVYRKFR